MASRKDLLKAHTFITQRLVAALVSRNPDELQPPLRRSKIGIFIGIMLSILITAGFGIWGLIAPGNSQNWKEDNSVVVDKSSGAVYVYLNGRLVPTPNIVSALLIAAGPTKEGNSADAKMPKVSTVDSRSLRGVERDLARGIPQAPAFIPHVDDLHAYPLRVCATKVDPAQTRRATTLEFMGPIEGGDSSVLLSNEARTDQFLVYRGVAHRLDAPRPPAFLNDRFDAIFPGDSFIRSLPVGAPLAPLAISEVGTTTSKAPSWANKVGTLIKFEDADETRYYVLQKDGFSRVTYIDGQLLEANPPSEVQDVTNNLDRREDVTRKYLNPNASLLNSGNMPEGRPRGSDHPQKMTASLCALYERDDAAPRIIIGPKVEPPPARPSDSMYADTIKQNPGTGALITTTTQVEDAEKGAATLVVDGKAYRTPNVASRAALRLTSPKRRLVERVPAQVIALIPPGLPNDLELSYESANRILR